MGPKPPYNNIMGDNSCHPLFFFARGIRAKSPQLSFIRFNRRNQVQAFLFQNLSKVIAILKTTNSFKEDFI
jgi:hypothetical protein